MKMEPDKTVKSESSFVTRIPFTKRKSFATISTYKGKHACIHTYWG